MKSLLLFLGMLLGLWWVQSKHEHRLNRIEYWIEVHHPLIPTYASPAQVKERGYWKP